MAEKNDVSGYVIKEETVHTLSHSIMPGTFVVEINHPFPGYYAEAMKEYSKPRSVILMTKKLNTWESILRTSEKLKRYLDLEFIASAAIMYIGRNEYHGIRLKGLEKFEDIATIQKAFTDEGFVFAKARSKFKDDTVLIKVKKFYNIEELGEGLYRDLKQQDVHFVFIPKKLNWEFFRKITRKIKNNISDSNYDVALVTFYINNGIQDALRIFKPNNNAKLLKEIQQMYFDHIGKYD
jgi:hypothetical protein